MEGVNNEFETISCSKKVRHTNFKFVLMIKVEVIQNCKLPSLHIVLNKVIIIIISGLQPKRAEAHSLSVVQFHKNVIIMYI